MAYIFLVIGLLITSPLIYKQIRLWKKHSGEKIYVVAWGTILVALVALRAKTIGRDTAMYEVIFQRTIGATSLRGFLKTYNTEYAYHALEYITSRFADYRFFVVLIACFSVIPVLFVICEFSEDKFLSLLLYVCFPYYTFCMSGMRQATAMGCIAIAYCFVKKKKVVWFIVFCILGFMFHSSAMLFLPVYWLDKIPYKKATRVIAILAMVMAFVLRTSLWHIATLFARQQYSANDAGGQKMYLFMILSVALGFIYRKEFVGENNVTDVDTVQNAFQINTMINNRVLLYLQILAVIIWPIASVNSATFRMYYYYHMFMILYVPALLNSVKSNRIRLLIKIGFMFAAIFFLYTQILPPQQGYNPYLFLWQ